jgi:hypothetical protein
MSGVVLAILASLFWLIGVTWAPTWIKKQIEGYSQQLGRYKAYVLTRFKASNYLA